MPHPNDKRPGGLLDSDLNARSRRVRLAVILGLPTLAAGVVLVLLGLPWWIVVGLLAFLGLGIVLQS
ncbi:MAG: hypothetical protein JJU45_18870 [Acidimicrobiia bacterium]|nr:hypothetical protein [Acidimicrobiia bacterium]